MEEGSEGEWTKSGVTVSEFARELLGAIMASWNEVQETYDDLLESGEYAPSEPGCRSYIDEVSCGAIRSYSMDLRDEDTVYRAMCMFVGVPIEIAIKHEGVREPEFGESGPRFFSIYDVKEDLHVHSIVGIVDDRDDPRRALVLYFGDCKIEDLWDVWSDHADAVDHAFRVYGEARERLRRHASNGQVPLLEFEVTR